MKSHQIVTGKSYYGSGKQKVIRTVCEISDDNVYFIEGNSHLISKLPLHEFANWAKSYWHSTPVSTRIVLQMAKHMTKA